MEHDLAQSAKRRLSSEHLQTETSVPDQLLTSYEQAWAYITVTLVANVSRTISASEDFGDVSEVNYLLGANGQPVRATTRRSIYCDQYINPDGSAKDRRSSGGSSGGGRSGPQLAILVPALIIGGIVLILILRCCCWRRKQLGPQRPNGEPGFLRRRWQRRQRRRAAETMGEPAFMDDTEKQAASANWSGAPADAAATQPGAVSQTVPFPLPTFASAAHLMVQPTATPDEGPDRIDAGPVPQGDAMDGVARPPPAYIAPPTYPSTRS